MRKRMSPILIDWSFFPDTDGMLNELAHTALPEKWNFANGSKKNQILWNYLIYTFKKLQMEKVDLWEERYRHGQTSETFDTISGVGVGYSHNFSLAAFNTGLVNLNYEPIIAVFEINTYRNLQPYKFKGFCVRGEGHLGKEVNSKIYGDLNRAKYFSDISDCVYLNPEADVQCSWEHIIIDGIRRRRFPDAFISRTCIDALNILQIKSASFNDVELRNIADFISKEETKSTQNTIKWRLESALRLALKRVTWNFKTAIPVWYPKKQKLSLLLPLSLIDDKTPDVALVVEQIQQSDRMGRKNINYTAHTIFTLDMAYNNSRLVCKPDSDWLIPENISPRIDISDLES